MMSQHETERLHGARTPRFTPQTSAEACFWIIGGGLLAWHGIRRSRLLGIATASLGTAMAYRGWMSWQELQNPAPCIAEPERPEPHVEQNRVDEAAWESFPASDPPAWNQATT
jgi:uncharacterized membrane protein